MKKAYISCRAYPELKAWLADRGYDLVELPEQLTPYPAISSHPDIYMCVCGDRIIMAQEKEIGNSYPDYLGYNGIFLDKYFIHNMKYSSPSLIHEAAQLGMGMIDVKQGYTKCACLVVDGCSIITADNGIASKLKSYPDINVLHIGEGYVSLEDFDYGFIGGATGRVDNFIVFNGDLEKHPDCTLIRSFIENRGLKIIDFKGHPLYDIGTIIVEKN